MINTQGWINIYKPPKISSFGALKKIKKKFNISKIGHGGTLDPLAEGILPVAIGKTTKLISFINNEIKDYEFEIKWGESTSTDDLEGEVIAKSLKIPNINEINNKLGELSETFFQTPPKSSAIKINGIRAYKLFKQNKNFEIKKRSVKLYEAKVLDSSKFNLTKIYIKCGKGFYVRSFARDLAESLGTKGHVFSLKRKKVGKFVLNNSILLDDLLKIRQRQLGFREIQPSISMLDDILAYEIDDENSIEKISQGNFIKIDKKKFSKKSLDQIESSIIFLTFKNNVLSYGKFDGDFFKPKKVLI